MRPAISDALAALSPLAIRSSADGLCSDFLLSPSSTSRRMASERVMPTCFLQASTAATSFRGSLMTRVPSALTTPEALVYVV